MQYKNSGTNCKGKEMLEIKNSPFAQFTDRINKDLFAWTLRKQQYEQLLKDYESTLNFVQMESNLSPNVLVDIGEGEGIFSEGRRQDGKIIIRLKEELYVEFKMKQGEKVLKDLILLYNEKIKSTETEIRKIMASMREVEQLIQQYSSLT